MANSKKAIDKSYLLTQFKNFDSELLSKKYSSKEETAKIEKAVFVDVNVFETESTNDFSIFNRNYGTSWVFWEYNNTSIKIGDILIIKKDLTLSGTYEVSGTTYDTTVTIPKGNYRYLKKFIGMGGPVSGIFVADTTTSFFDPSSNNYGQYWQTLESKNITKLDEFKTEVDKEFNLIRNNLICSNVTRTQNPYGYGYSFVIPTVSDIKVGDIVYVSEKISVSFNNKTGTFEKGFYKCTAISNNPYTGGTMWVVFGFNGIENNEYLGETLTDSILSTMVSDLYGGAIGEPGKDGSKIWLFTGSTLTDYNQSSYWDVPFTKLAGQEGTPVKGDFVLGRSDHGDGGGSYPFSKGTRLAPISEVANSKAQINYTDFNAAPELGAEHLGAASGTAAGIVTTTAQSFKGKKTFLPESGSYGSSIDGGSVYIGDGLYGYDYSPGHGSCNEASILLGFENPGEGAELIGYAFSGSIGMGYGPYANNQSAAIGISPHAENTSIAIGTSTTALNNSSGFGEKCYADKWAHAQGYKTTAINLGSHAEGSLTYAKSSVETAGGGMGQGSHAEGYKTSALGGSSGYGIHAEGTNTYASDISAYYGGEHAEGYYTSSCGGHYGGGTHAEGSSTRAYNGGHAEGYCTSCGTGDDPVGCYCHVEGYYTSASSHAYGQHVSGKYNKGGSSNIFEVGNGSSNTARSNAFTVTYAGEVKAANTITGSTTADYAEYFEWKDGNPNNEDRICKFVTLDGNKITTATSNEDYILGVISVKPFVLGNADIDNWNGMYVRDKFGRIIYEDRQLTHLNVETGEEEISYDADGNPFIEKIPVINPDFDPNREYVGRADRPEWSPVGMLGQLLVYQDGTAEVNKYVCCNKEGIATACDKLTENAYRVIEVIDNELVRIIFK